MRGCQPSTTTGSQKIWRHIAAACGAVIAVGLLVAALNFRQVQIAWHQAGMRWASEEWTALNRGAKPSMIGLLAGLIRSGDAWDWYEYHSICLVKLEALAHRRYVFRHVTYPSGDARWVFGELSHQRHVVASEFEWMSAGRGPGNHYAVEVFCDPDDVQEWDELISRYDVPGLREQFVVQLAK